MARLHTETIPTSTLASTARVVDGFVTTQSDHSGITSSFTRAYTATGITQTATDGRGNTTTTHTDLAGRTISSTDAADTTTTTVYDAAFDAPSVITNAQGKTACYKYDLRGRKVAEWGTAKSTKALGGLDKCAAFAPKGRAADGAAASQSDRGPGESLDKRVAFARRARSREAAPSQPIQWSSEYNDSELGLVYYNYRHYNSREGRWVSRDEKEQESGLDLYQYILNRSIDKKDVMGHFLCEDECDQLGVREGKVDFKITSIYGENMHLIEGFKIFSDAFEVETEVLGYLGNDPRMESLDLYSEAISSFSQYIGSMARPDNNRLWMVLGCMEYEVCQKESCCLFWEHKALSSETTGWISGGDWILPEKTQEINQAMKKVMSKLKREVKKATKNI